MKKQTNKQTLNLNKFKIASISTLGKSKIFGGDGDDPGTHDTLRKSQVVDGNTDCRIRK